MLKIIPKIFFLYLFVIIACAPLSPPINIYKSDELVLAGQKIAIVEITGYNSEQIENELSVHLLTLGVNVLERNKLNKIIAISK